MTEQTIDLGQYAIMGAGIFIIGALMMITIVALILKRQTLKKQGKIEDREVEDEVLENETRINAKNKDRKSEIEKEQGVGSLTNQPKSEAVMLHFEQLLEEGNSPLAIALETQISIGRAKAKNDWVIEDMTVSSKHCKIYRQQGIIYIIDLNSTNGTRVNGKEIEEPVAIRSGDEIQIGRLQYKLTMN